MIPKVTRLFTWLLDHRLLARTSRRTLSSALVHQAMVTKSQKMQLLKLQVELASFFFSNIDVTTCIPPCLRWSMCNCARRETHGADSGRCNVLSTVSSSCCIYRWRTSMASYYIYTHGSQHVQEVAGWFWPPYYKRGRIRGDWIATWF